MNRKGIGVGTASLVLVFTVVCLVIFTIISYTSASNEMSLSQSEARLVVGYYEADALANRIISEILVGDMFPDSLYGVEISTYWNSLLEAQVVEFSCDVTPQMELFVRVAFVENDYDILIWQLRNTDPWEHDTGIPLLIY